MRDRCVTALDESADVRYRSLTSYRFATSVPQASGTGSGNPPLPFSHTAVAAPKGLLVAVSSEIEDSVYAITSPCLLCVFTVTKILKTTFSGVSGGLLRKSPTDSLPAGSETL